MSKLSDTAAEKFLAGCNCAQAVILPFYDQIGMDEQTARDVACGFGGGMAGRQEICGAVSGGVMVIGMMLGKDADPDRVLVRETYTKSDEFIARFEAVHNTANCLQLLDGHVFSTEEGRAAIKELDLRNKVCLQCVKTSVEILEDMTKELSE
ncbi:MAG: C_GCAxxG_C_C family protein [Phycisphaerales bacterium]|jgi:C_GCAxxG_C_C family probable redox protein|nr:C_GCAxxG_C_C family protein [Phycisphaerales bacterium]